MAIKWMKWTLIFIEMFLILFEHRKRMNQVMETSETDLFDVK